MHELGEKDVLRWENQDGWNAPAQISLLCEGCNIRVAFQLAAWNSIALLTIAVAAGECSVCRRRERFILLDPSSVGHRPRLSGTLYTTGNPAPGWSALDPENIPEEIYRAYLGTVQSLNAAVWAGTAVCCRRTLEGIIKFQLPDEHRKRSLADCLNILGEHVDLSKPLKDLSHTIRHGGNLGAHFDLSREPDSEMARQMVELLEALLNYLFKLPARIVDLDKDLSSETGETSQG